MIRPAYRQFLVTAVLLLLGCGLAVAQTDKVYDTRTGAKYHRGK
jgi:hypothetical protein